ncbi:MAG: hypothetical protein BWY17_04863 [Deltaproteobacteria bacterium ADurb.Bin207]|nr:MAG: hypothetical protein BWY17_04863 [Deltaproteobacteria bacterium ADurb.Bin207]
MKAARGSKVRKRRRTRNNWLTGFHNRLILPVDFRIDRILPNLSIDLAHGFFASLPVGAPLDGNFHTAIERGFGACLFR